MDMWTALTATSPSKEKEKKGGFERGYNGRRVNGGFNGRRY